MKALDTTKNYSVYCIFLLINFQLLWHKIYKVLPPTDNSLLATDKGRTLVKAKMERTCGQRLFPFKRPFWLS